MSYDFVSLTLYFSALRLTVTCCLLLDLYPLEEGLAQYIKSRRKLGLTLTGLVPLNASGSLYQLEKGLRNKRRSCLLSSAVRLSFPALKPTNAEIFSSTCIQERSLYQHTRLHVRVGYRPQGSMCTFIPNDLVY